MSCLFSSLRSSARTTLDTFSDDEKHTQRRQTQASFPAANFAPSDEAANERAQALRLLKVEMEKRKVDV